VFVNGIKQELVPWVKGHNREPRASGIGPTNFALRDAIPVESCQYHDFYKLNLTNK
jgi:hypothetical protein